ncbi:basic salivary proline-rich protein 1-like [Penaeus monodon]|uniref:basic salivary proline-rich protein 1-like n=1 Tax=Penaeus monodon TaxID=6687 RepID=UPI0018A6D66C|nr:basic salivary proline-rich protein 1-like [Penaeus monodon]
MCKKCVEISRTPPTAIGGRFGGPRFLSHGKQRLGFKGAPIFPRPQAPKASQPSSQPGQKQKGPKPATGQGQAKPQAPAKPKQGQPRPQGPGPQGAQAQQGQVGQQPAKARGGAPASDLP